MDDSVILLFTTKDIKRMNQPFVISTAWPRRQLKVEVEFFNVCKLLNILLQIKKKTEFTKSLKRCAGW